jgi:hypothetical protein
MDVRGFRGRHDREPWHPGDAPISPPGNLGYQLSMMSMSNIEWSNIE